MSDTISQRQKQDPAEVLAVALRPLTGDWFGDDAAAVLINALAEAGYAIVPAEPTAEMIEGAYRKNRRGTDIMFKKVWSGMLAARPGR